MSVSLTVTYAGHHGSVEGKPGMPFIGFTPVLNSDPPNPPGSYAEPGATISHQILPDGAKLSALTDYNSLWSWQKWNVDYLQMSAGLKGVVTVCGCCPDGDVELSWSRFGALTWGGPSNRGYSNGKIGIYGTPNLLVNRSDPVDADTPKTTVTIPADGGCPKVDFELSLGWEDYDQSTAGGAFGLLLLKVSAACP